MSDETTPIRVLFVCLGNICRSPTAHGVFRQRVEDAGLAHAIEIDSAGTGDWHVGKPPDRRATAAARQRGVDIEDLRARRVRPDDLQTFDYVIAMDDENLESLLRMARRTDNVRAHIGLFGDYSTRFARRPVPDPYFGGDRGFERVLDMIEDASDGLLRDMRTRLEAH